MKCREVQDLLPACLEEGLLSPREEEEILRHLSTCPACGEALADLRRSRELLRTLEEVDPPAGFRETILTRIGKASEEKKTLWQVLFHPFHIKLPLQALATALMAVLVITVFRGMEGDRTVRNEVPPAVVEETMKDGVAVSESQTLREKTEAFSHPGEKRVPYHQTEPQRKTFIQDLSGAGKITLLVRDGKSARLEVETLLGRYGVPYDMTLTEDRKTILTLKTDTRLFRKLFEELKKTGTVSRGGVGQTDNGLLTITLEIIENP